MKNNILEYLFMRTIEVVEQVSLSDGDSTNIIIAKYNDDLILHSEHNRGDHMLVNIFPYLEYYDGYFKEIPVKDVIMSTIPVEDELESYGYFIIPAAILDLNEKEFEIWARLN